MSIYVAHTEIFYQVYLTLFVGVLSSPYVGVTPQRSQPYCSCRLIYFTYTCTHVTINTIEAMMNQTVSIHSDKPLVKAKGSHNWDAMKMRYCLLHEELDDIAISHQVTPAFLKQLADVEGWEQVEVPEIVKAVEGIDPQTLMESVQDRVDVIQVHKELALLPALLEIESSLVSKLRSTLSADKDLKPKDMKMLVDAYTTLTSRQRIFRTDVPTSGVPHVTMNGDFGGGSPDDD